MLDYLTNKMVSHISKIICHPFTFKIIVIGLVILILVVELCSAWCFKSSFSESIVGNTTRYSIIFMIVTFLYLSLDALLCSKEVNKARLLVDVLKGSLSISAIPTGISLIVCSFPNKIWLIVSMGGVEVYIAFAGLSIAAIGLLSALQGQQDVEKEPPKIDGTKDTMELIKDSNKVGDNNINNLIDH